jgi:hypothetical protein
MSRPRSGKRYVRAGGRRYGSKHATHPPTYGTLLLCLSAANNRHPSMRCVCVVVRALSVTYAIVPYWVVFGGVHWNKHIGGCAGGSRIVPGDLAIVIDGSGRAIIIDIPIINWVDTIPTWLEKKLTGRTDRVLRKHKNRKT